MLNFLLIVQHIWKCKYNRFAITMVTTTHWSLKTQLVGHQNT